MGPARRVQALREVPELLKRVALSMPEAPAVAPLHAADWQAFLVSHSSTPLPADFAWQLAQLRRYQGDLIPDEVKLYVRDVHDHAVRISDVIDTLREMLGTALSVNLSLVTLAQGETVKRLGAWAALLAAPTLITSWYGMNFHGMPELVARVLAGRGVAVDEARPWTKGFTRRGLRKQLPLIRRLSEKPENERPKS